MTHCTEGAAKSRVRALGLDIWWHQERSAGLRSLVSSLETMAAACSGAPIWTLGNAEGATGKVERLISSS